MKFESFNYDLLIFAAQIHEFMNCSRTILCALFSMTKFLLESIDTIQLVLLDHFDAMILQMGLFQIKKFMNSHLKFYSYPKFEMNLINFEPKG